MEAEVIAKVVRTFLGVEDHGIFTAQVTLDYGHSGQNAGGYALDTYDPEKKCRVATAFGLEWVMRFMEAVGASTWEEVNGKTILAIVDQEGYGKVLGVKALPTERGGMFRFDSLSPKATEESNAGG